MNEFEQKQQNDYEKRKLKAYITRRSLMDFGMGLIYFAIGGFFLLSKQFGFVIKMGANLSKVQCNYNKPR